MLGYIFILLALVGVAFSNEGGDDGFYSGPIEISTNMKVSFVKS